MTKTKKKLPPSISEAAEPRGSGPTAYWLDGKPIAYVNWHDNGVPAWYWHCDSEGKKHGIERYVHRNGCVQWQTNHEHGLQHGKQSQWDEDGNLICETVFEKGTGRDLWWGSNKHLSEYREYVHGMLHGLEQCWQNRKHVFREGYYFEGLEHGVFREWKKKNRLDSGFPKFYIHGNEVSKAEYLSRTIWDPTLPPYKSKKNRSSRTLAIPRRGLVAITKG
jgi:hypothetical protein